MKDVRLRLAFGGLHPDRLRDLTAAHGAAGALRRLLAGEVNTTERVRTAVRVSAEERREQLARAGTEVLYNGDSGFPAALAALPDAPDVLFLRGAIPPLPGVAVVGARRCTSYGRRVAEGYGRAIAAAGWTVISGLARGIDGAAHRGTVGCSGGAIAVLGSGIDVMYPREHRDLALEIIETGGAIISEYPPGTPPEGWRFPPRNRVISGLADAVVVVEATVKGGALITAEAALSQGRQVFAVPGDVGRPTSEGCNLLIRDGAFPTLDPADLVESLELVMGPRPAKVTSAREESLDAADRQLVELIAAGKCQTDELLAAIDATAQEGLVRLGSLEMRGVIKSDGPGRYAV